MNQKTKTSSNSTAPKPAKIAAIILIAAIGLLYLMYFWGLTIDDIKHYTNIIQSYAQAHKATTLLIYLMSYIIFAILPLPGETILNVLGGSLYGTLLGTFLAMSASLIGASITFLVTRHYLGQQIKKRYLTEYRNFYHHLQKQGKFYLLGIRFLPTTPSFLDNLIAGLMPISIKDYLLITIIGIFPVTLLTIRAGEKLTELTSLDDILSPEWLFILFGLSALSFMLPLIKLIKNGRLFTQNK